MRSERFKNDRGTFWCYELKLCYELGFPGTLWCYFDLPYSVVFKLKNRLFLCSSVCLNSL